MENDYAVILGNGSDVRTLIAQLPKAEALVVAETALRTITETGNPFGADRLLVIKGSGTVVIKHKLEKQTEENE